MKKLLTYFFNGLLLVLPVAATYYVLAFTIVQLDGLIPVPIPGLGIVIVLAAITFIGYLGRNVLIQPIVRFLEKIILRLPIISVIYKSTRDFAEAFLGNERKFENPVLYDMSGQGDYRIAFLTQESMKQFELDDFVGVYVPHSYNFSGNFYVVPRSRIRDLKMTTSEAMRLAVTGGVVNVDLPKKDLVTPSKPAL